MKRIILTLTVAFAVVTTTSHAKDYAFGIKAGFRNTNIMGLDKAKKPFEAKDKMFNPGVVASIYGEYAFHEYVGAELEAGYFMGMLDSFENKADAKCAYNLMGQAAFAKIGPKFYVLGREDAEEMGNLSVKVTGNFTFLPSVKGQKVKDGKDDGSAEEAKSEDLTPFGVGAGITVGYEFPFGLLVALQGGYTFTDLFKENADFKKTKLGITDSKDATNVWHSDLAIGYNFATLLEE